MYSLNRIPSTQKTAIELEREYTTNEQKARTLVDKLSSSGNNSNSSVGTSPQYGSPPLTMAGEVAIIYHSLNGNKGSEGKMAPSYDITIEENIHDCYRTGKMALIDYYGHREFFSLLNTLEKESFEIKLKNAIEEKTRSIFFGLYNVMDHSVDTGIINRSQRENMYTLVEEPFFNNYNTQTFGDSYKECTASQIICSLLTKYGGVKNLYLIKGDNDPIFPSFIIPNWTIEKTINYLRHFSSSGTIKIFNISIDGETITVVSPLQKLLKVNSASGIYQCAPLQLYPSASIKTADGLPLGEFIILGPKPKHIQNFLTGQTIINFDYMYGKNDNQEFTTILPLEEAKYKWPSYFNNKEDRAYGSIIAGQYGDGAKIVANIGDILLFKKDSRSFSNHNISIDSYTKPLIEELLKNNFYDSYFDQINLKTTLPGNSRYQVGMLVDIQIPSVDQSGKGNNKDITLSGKWLLWKIVHKISMVGDGTLKRAKYTMDAYFTRTGMELSYNKLRDSVSTSNTSPTNTQNTTIQSQSNVAKNQIVVKK